MERVLAFSAAINGYCIGCVGHRQPRLREFCRHHFQPAILQGIFALKNTFANKRLLKIARFKNAQGIRKCLFQSRLQTQSRFFGAGT